MGFDADTELRPVGERIWEGTIDEGWWTPHGPHGGYVMAFVLRGMESAVGDTERQARSATMHFLRPPEAGAITVSATVEREGRSLTTVSGRLEQNGKPMGLALGAYSKPWEGPLLDESPMPVVEAPDESRPPVGDLPRRNPPPFTDGMTMQHRFGDRAFSGSDRAEIGGWIGLREERPIDAPLVAVLADAWFPAPWPRLKALAPAPTIDLTIHFRSPLPVPDGLLLGRFRSRYARDGFFEEDGELWSEDGTLVAQSRQLGLLIGAEVP
jgi:acyl-CoA thioesterase